jgi:menaquinone-9 beta-reductase
MPDLLAIVRAGRTFQEKATQSDEKRYSPWCENRTSIQSKELMSVGTQSEVIAAMGTDFDVAVIGAGPAGSAAATVLARAGCRVVMFEKRVFPREKVCGGCLSGPAVELLRAVAGQSEPLPGVETRSITFTIGDCRFACDPRGATRVVMRSELDEWLAKQATAAGADVRFGQAAGLVRGDRGWEVEVGDSRVRAKTILVACGLSTLPKKLGIAGQAMKRRMISQQWVQRPEGGLPGRGHIEMHWLRGGYVGLATPTDDRCVVATAVDVSEDTKESAWGRLRRLNPETPLWSIVPADAPQRYSARGTAGFPWAPERLGAENFLLIGDAAGYEEPFTGEGMGQAVCSATCASRAILKGGDIVGNYAVLMKRHHRPCVKRLRLLGRVLRNPVARMLASVPAMRLWNPLTRLIERTHVGATA